MKPGTSDRDLARRISAWFVREGRALPWRTTPRDPYRSLVSEFMLQQTQVARVLERYEPFLREFPTVLALASAPEAEVLGAWSGLGYYRRARFLHRAAQELVGRFGARVPETPTELRTLPGVGRYTAGALDPIVHGRAEPIVDGNVSRVLMRLDGREGSPTDAAPWAWERAESLVHAADDPASLNEGLMELGATVCTPRRPACERCPARARCVANATARQNEIPAPKPAPARRELYCASVVLRDARGRLLVERRPEDGMWAGLWQAPTLERDDRTPAKRDLATLVRCDDLRRDSSFTHQTTHRLVRFVVWTGRGARAGSGRCWKSRTEIERLGVSNAQRRILRG